MLENLQRSSSLFQSKVQKSENKQAEKAQEQKKAEEPQQQEESSGFQDIQKRRERLDSEQARTSKQQVMEKGSDLMQR